MKGWLLILFLAVLSVCSFAQETIVVGEVYDANTGQPIPNVNIYLLGTLDGVATNEDGYFLLRKELTHPHVMIVSAVGYHTERFKIEPYTQSGIEIALREKVGSLEEVFVTPRENPALPLMEKVRANRMSNRLECLTDSIESTTALYVSHIQSKHLKRALWKKLQAGMIEQPDSTYLMPLYWRKQQNDTVKEYSTLLTLTDYQMLLGQIPTSFDFYSNTLPFLNTSILSPLAASGNMYYKYYLVDSVQVQQEKHYLLHFRARNPFQAIFNGEMTIDSASYALRSIKVSLPVQTSVNYLKELTINQKFASTNHLQDESVNLLMDFAVKVAANRDSTHIFPTILYTRETHYPVLSREERALPADTLTEVILPALDSLNNTPLFKTAKFIAYILQTGCIPTNSVVEVGKIHHLIRMNKVGGVRIGLPLRTTELLWKNVCLESMVAYGTGDRAFKGFGKISIALPTERRHTMYLKYNDDYMFSDVDEFQEYLRENKVFNPQVNLITHMMQGWQFNPNYYYNTLTRRQEGRVHFYDEWNKYLETQAYFKIGKSGYGEPTHNYNAQPSVFYSTLGVSARLSFNERKVDSYFQRRYIYNKMPVVYVGAEIGSYYLEGMPSYRMYGNLQLMLRHNVDLGIGGELNYVLQAGIILGKVPYTFLHHFTANQTYTFDIYRFSLMNNYQYAADQYISLQAHWNGKGVLFNLIPGVRHARLRELLELKVAYGGLCQDHESVIPFPISRQGHTTLNALTIPYVELGVGIGNILRIGELYGVFRLTHLDDVSAPWAAVRFRLHIGM